MGYVKKLTIIGYKKFKKFTIDFNENKSIIVGANEAGKSTILDAIDLILNQRGITAEKNIIWDMLNVENIDYFEANPTVDNLPSIKMELDLEFSSTDNNAHEFCGENTINGDCKKGILFKCEFDKDSYGDLLDLQIRDGDIPVEYYQMSWTKYNGEPYKKYKKPFNSLLINTDKIDATSSFNYFNRTIFRNKNEENKIMKAKNNFSTKVIEAFGELDLSKIDGERKFDINRKRILLESLIAIYDNKILLENKGCGTENLIKTNIALDRDNNKNDVVLIEEPENHLSHETLLKMINELENNDNVGQLIITTHNDLITSKLGLQNVIWINANQSKTLSDIDEDTAKFFMKLDSNNLLYFLLSEKVLLVEGPTEGLLLPYIYKKIRGKDITNEKVSIISCGGVSYKRYLQIAKNLDKKVAVITDNDEKVDNINFMNSYNNSINYPTQKIFMDTDPKEWTWEVCFYNMNEEYFNNNINIEENRHYSFKNVSYMEINKPVLGKMLNNKVDIAYKMIEWGLKDINVPKYIEDAIKWINE